MSSEAKRLLFVCTGNTCRSVMAEYLMRKISEERGLGLTLKSCGLAAERYFPIPPAVRAILKDEGIARVEHVATIVTRELLDWTDLVLTMTEGHRQALLDEFPEHAAKIHVLRRYAGLPQEDIEDPIGQPEAVYAACRDKIREALEAVAKKHEHAQDPRP